MNFTLRQPNRLFCNMYLQTSRDSNFWPNFPKRANSAPPLHTAFVHWRLTFILHIHLWSIPLHSILSDNIKEPLLWLFFGHYEDMPRPVHNCSPSKRKQSSIGNSRLFKITSLTHTIPKYLHMYIISHMKYPSHLRTKLDSL